MQIETEYRERIQRICPELVIHSLMHNQEGLANDIVIVNGDTVFRFAKGEFGQESLARELSVLERIRPHLPVLIPRPFYQDSEAMAYALLPGEPLTCEVLRAQEGEVQQQFADALGAFFHALHSLPLSEADLSALPQTPAPCRYADWIEIRQQAEAHIYPLLLPFQQRWTERLFDRFLSDDSHFDYTPTLVHGDIAPYHLLYTPGSCSLSGVIDFGVGGIGDPATDIAALLTWYGESFAACISANYPHWQERIGRARFYAQAIELQWVLNGLKSGETFWFTAHLGTARNLGD